MKRSTRALPRWAVALLVAAVAGVSAYLRPSPGRHDDAAPTTTAPRSAPEQAPPPVAGMYQAGPHSVGGVTVTDIRTGKRLSLGVVDLKPTLDRIAAGKKFPHANDGTVWENRSRKLPAHPKGYYREYVVPTEGISGPGPQRLVMGKGGEVYYTPDHYETFLLLEKSP